MKILLLNILLLISTNFLFASKPVTVTAKLIGTNFRSVPIDQLNFDIFGKKKMLLDFIKYDSVTGNFKCKFTISEPQLMLFFLKEVYVTPGDSIDIKYIVFDSSNENYHDTMIVSGTNAGNYSYYTFTRNEYTFLDKTFPIFEKPYSHMRLKTYEKKLKLFFDRNKNKFIESVAKIEHTKEYEKYVMSNFYLYESYFYLNALNQIENITDLPRKIQIKKYVNVNIDTGSHYYFSVLRLLRKHKVKLYNLIEFTRQIKEAKLNAGIVKDYLIYSDITEFLKNKRNVDVSLAKALQAAYNEIDYRKYRSLINYNKLLNYSYSEAVPQNILSATIIEKDGKISTLQTIIKNNSGFYIYIDFWASWCLPCRQESESFKSIFLKFKDKPIKYIQISIDTDNEKWLKAVSDDNNSSASQYRLYELKDFKKIKEKYDFIGIPYYILLNKSGLVNIQNAPRPSDANLAKIFMEIN
ncbi:MAG TPA: thioredoxin family protein [Ferruginibacter sp.]|nr:thioredoxin family protein [Ferruginibacter sp.]